jgi:hypothetical protein
MRPVPQTRDRTLPQGDPTVPLPIPRRDFLKSSVATAAGLGTAAGLAAPGQLSAARLPNGPERIAIDPEILPLVRLLEGTAPDKLIPVALEQMARGLPYRRLLAATFLQKVRGASSHDVWVVHSLHQTGLDVSREDQLLPLMWSLRYTPDDHPGILRPLNEAALPAPAKAARVFEGAMEGNDAPAARAAIVAVARSEGPRAAMDRFWRWGAACCGGGNIGHNIIGVANTYRTLEVIGWRYAEPVLQFVTFYTDAPKAEAEVTGLNARRAKESVGKLRPDWAGGKSDKGAVLELLAFVREGHVGRACEWAYDRLVAGKLQAATVWDAVFLASAELIVRYEVGSVTGRPLHSMTMANALNYAFRTCSEPETRLRILLEAIHWGCDFYTVERGRGNLRDLRITAIPESDSPAAVTDAVDDIFGRLPPRRGRMRNRTGDDKAMELTYALARKHDHGPFFQTARRLMCRKALDAHEFKFPVAVFENYEHVSPEWRPHLLAAAVHVLQGPRMEDSTAYLQAREELRRLR